MYIIGNYNMSFNVGRTVFLYLHVNGSYTEIGDTFIFDDKPYIHYNDDDDKRRPVSSPTTHH